MADLAFFELADCGEHVGHEAALRRVEVDRPGERLNANLGFLEGSGGGAPDDRIAADAVLLAHDHDVVVVEVGQQPKQPRPGRIVALARGVVVDHRLRPAFRSAPLTDQPRVLREIPAESRPDPGRAHTDISGGPISRAPRLSWPDSTFAESHQELMIVRSPTGMTFQ